MNKSTAALMWPNEDALGQTIRVGDEFDAGWLTVVGVVSNSVISPLQESRTGHQRVYFSYHQSPMPAVDLLFRSEDIPALDAVTRLSQQVNAGLAPVEIAASMGLSRLGNAAGIRLGTADQVLLAVTGCGVLFLCLAASWAPIRKAITTDPVETLRIE